MKTRTRLLSVGSLLLVATPLAHAHPGHEGHDLTWDFTGGFAHPLSGWDHLLAMVAVGLWAAQLSGRARWWVPSAFVAVMALGALFGRAGLIFPGIEQGIAASVLVLGLLIATTAKLPIGAGMALVGFFAAFHGLAHGAEMPATAGGLSFGFGFVAATVLLHAIGLGVGVFAERRSARIVRLAGWALAASGVMLFV